MMLCGGEMERVGGAQAEARAQLGAQHENRRGKRQLDEAGQAFFLVPSQGQIPATHRPHQAPEFHQRRYREPPGGLARERASLTRSPKTASFSNA